MAETNLTGTVRIAGLSELQKTLRELPAKLRERAVLNACFSGAAVIRDEAIRRAPVDEGRLRGAIVVARSKRTGYEHDAEAIVIVRKGRKTDDPTGAYYASFVEFGHRVRPRRGALGTDLVRSVGIGLHGVGGFGRRETRAVRGSRSSARYGRSGGARLALAGATVKHVAPRPFLRPAFDSKRTEAFERFRQSLADGIDKVVRKLAAPTTRRRGVR